MAFHRAGLVKVTKEKLPRSVVAFDIELDHDQVEKELDRVARRLSQKHTIRGFRKGKAPRSVIESHFGRETLFEEASNELIEQSIQEVLKQEHLTPIGQVQIESVQLAETLRFRFTVPVATAMVLPDYYQVRIPLEVAMVTDEMVQRAMSNLREKHVALLEVEEPRPARQGDQLMVRMAMFDGDRPLNQPEEGQELPQTTLLLEPDRLVDEVYACLVGGRAGETVETTARMRDDYTNEKLRGKDVTFKIEIVGLHERFLPSWEELPDLEGVEEGLEGLQKHVRENLENAAHQAAVQRVVDQFVAYLVEQTDYDVAEVMAARVAEQLLHEEEQDLARVGLTMEQVLERQGQTREQAIQRLIPLAEKQYRTTMVLSKFIEQERLSVSNSEVREEIKEILRGHREEERNYIRKQLSGPHREMVAQALLDRKLRERIVEIVAAETDVTGEAGGSRGS
ncbi:MAG: trigger factor [Chloroflexaceae bacterium]|nr:trigger factor [Chloroflexaceae bacterium]